MLSRVIENTSCYNLNNEDMLREVIVKIGLERIDTQEGVTVEVLLDSGAIRLVISLEFARKQVFKLKKIEKSIYEKCGQFLQQGGTYWAYSRNEYLLSGTQGEDRDWYNWWSEVECNFGNTMASLPQSWDWLEGRRSKDDKVSRRMWKIVEAKAGKTRVAKIKRWREEREREKETRRERVEEEGRKEKEEKTKKEENGRSEESGGEMGDLGWRWGSSKVRERGQEIGFSKVPWVDLCLWKESK